MARTRLELHEILCDLLGSRNVYFKPPNAMRYPCIKYERAKPSVQYADNIAYRNTKCYTLTYIDVDPDSSMPDQIEKLPMCTLDRFYIADGLHHSVFTLYF